MIMSTYRTSFPIAVIFLILTLAVGQEPRSATFQAPPPQEPPTKELPIKNLVDRPKTTGNIKSVYEAVIKPPNTRGYILQGCLGANDEWIISVIAGQHFVVLAATDNDCKGWTFRQSVGLFGPEGLPDIGPRSGTGLMDPNSRSGALIASSTPDAKFNERYNPKDRDSVLQAFQSPLYVGTLRVDTSPVNGNLHLSMNTFLPRTEYHRGSITLWIYIYP
jgi:hypothetical protein